MSTSYYLHSTGFPESVQIGTSTGSRWITDTSIARYSDHGWSGTAQLVGRLKTLGSPLRSPRRRPWVSDEYGRVMTARQAARLIARHPEHQELNQSG